MTLALTPPYDDRLIVPRDLRLKCARDRKYWLSIRENWPKRGYLFHPLRRVNPKQLLGTNDTVMATSDGSAYRVHKDGSYRRITLIPHSKKVAA